MAVLAVPDLSQLLLVNPVLRCSRQLDGRLALPLSNQFHKLSMAADQALVPRYFAVSELENERDAWLSTLCEKSKPRVFKFDHDRPVWSNVDLLDTMRQEDREQLFVCGFWLDDVVTSVALEAQPLGFNTHVIVDLSIAHSRQQRQVCFDRLNQYGIVPITLQNLLYEWMANTEDDLRRRELEVLWREHRHLDGRGASA